jgi:hypothetical protein
MLLALLFGGDSGALLEFVVVLGSAVASSLKEASAVDECEFVYTLLDGGEVEMLDGAW